MDGQSVQSPVLPVRLPRSSLLLRKTAEGLTLLNAYREDWNQLGAFAYILMEGPQSHALQMIDGTKPMGNV